MVLDGVSRDDRVVRDLTAFLESSSAESSSWRCCFSAKIVALTHEERLAVLAALDRSPWEFEEVRDLFLAGDR